jgi:hypothetical protein
MLTMFEGNVSDLTPKPIPVDSLALKSPSSNGNYYYYCYYSNYTNRFYILCLCYFSSLLVLIVKLMFELFSYNINK